MLFASCSDSEMLRYAYAELEESRGAIQVYEGSHSHMHSVLDFKFLAHLLFLTLSFLVQPAKKVYESLLGDVVNATALSHIQVCSF